MGGHEPRLRSLQLRAEDMPDLRLLLLAVLVSGICGCFYKRVYKVEPAEFNTILDRRGMRRRRPTRWRLVETWVRNQADVNWLYSDSRVFNSYLSLCEMFGVNPEGARASVADMPDGWHKDPLVLAESTDETFLRHKKTQLYKAHRVGLNAYEELAEKLL